jgi:hypothetical protein
LEALSRGALPVEGLQRLVEQLAGYLAVQPAAMAAALLLAVRRAG